MKRIVLLIFCSLLFGCGDASDTVDGGNTNTSTNTDTVGFYESKVQPIWNVHCTPCHVGGGSSGGMKLDAGVSHGNIVNVKANGLPLNRITPNNVLNSYLLHKLKGTQSSVGGFGSRMPQSGPPFLTDAQIATIEQWVNEGAQK